MAEKGKVFTGARARFVINGEKVGYARNVSGVEQIQYEPVDVLDNIQTEEFVAVGYTVQLTAEKVRIIGETLKSKGWFPKLGGNPNEHLTNILTSGDLTVTVEDSRTSKIFATYEQAKVSNHNWAIDARGVVGENMEFVAIRALDESEVI